MITAQHCDKELVVNILTESFLDNKSVNYIIKQDDKRIHRIRSLMAYSFDCCSLFGEVFLSDDKKSCALVIYPEKKKSSLKAILLDLQLISKAIGVGNISKAMKRENFIQSFHPKDPFSYLWFIGTTPDYQGRGIGKRLLGEIVEKYSVSKRPVYLETSTFRNLPFYKNLGFSIYKESTQFGYPLFFLSNN